MNTPSTKLTVDGAKLLSLMPARMPRFATCRRPESGSIPSPPSRFRGHCRRRQYRPGRSVGHRGGQAARKRLLGLADLPLHGFDLLALPGRQLTVAALHARKHRPQRVIIFLRYRIELVVVAAGAGLDRQAARAGDHLRDHVVQIVGPGLAAAARRWWFPPVRRNPRGPAARKPVAATASASAGFKIADNCSRRNSS